jgi:Domain of unknown function (DUF4349)
MTPTPARILVPALLLATLALTGCSGSDGDADSGTSGGSSASDSGAGVAPEARQDLASGADAEKVAAADTVVPQEQALIRKGSIELRAEDVGRAQIEVQKVVDRYSGQVTDEKTQSDDKGEPAYTRMVLRVPTQDFRDAVAALKGVAELETAKTTQDDVTNEVIDVRTRVGVQRRSIARITVLFEQARSIRDIMAIEAELSQRQADLEALEQQEAHLADQTSLSTIVVSVDRIPATKATGEKDDGSGFLAGLSAGWAALSTFASGLATVTGALLPWLVVVLVLGIPVLLLVRSLRRRAQPSE